MFRSSLYFGIPVRNRSLCYRGILSVMLVLVVGVHGLAGACECGDATGDGRISSGDIIYIINFMFKGGALPDPWECADVNHDYALTASDAITLVGYIFRGDVAPECPPVGVPVTHTGCKMILDPQPVVGPSPDETCMAFAFDGAGTLHVRHMNAAFNCCPEELRVAIEREPGFVRIIESEVLGAGGGCDCLCLFDLEFDITDIYGTYTFSVIEPYKPASDEPFEFTIAIGDLIAIDTQCVARTGYPWGMPGGPALRIESTSTCKSFSAGAAADSIPAAQDCVFYSYDSARSVLQLDHVNAVFNCCPVIGAEVDVTGSVITITERESPDSLGYCACLCLFDVSYEVWQLPPDLYTIRIEGLYLDPGDDSLVLTADLTTTPVGSHCVTRSGYPWEP